MKATIAGATARVLASVRKHSVLDKVRMGMPLYEIAGDLGISTGEASAIMEDELKNELKRKELETKHLILTMHHSGNSNNSIAVSLNVSLGAITKILTRHYSKELKVDRAVSHFNKKEVAKHEPAITSKSIEKARRNKEVIRAYSNGMSVKELAEHYSLNLVTVYAILKAEKVSLKRGIESEKRARLDWESIVQDYNEGMKVKMIADKYETGYPWIYTILRKKGVLKSSVRNAKERFEQIKQLYEEGKKGDEIAAALQMKRSSVWNVLRQKGYKAMRQLEHRKAGESIQRQYSEGKTREELAKQFNKDLDYVSRMLRKKGHVFSDPDRVKKIEDSFRVGKTLAETALAFGVSRQRVQKVLRNAGLAYLTAHQQHRQDITVLYNNGNTIPEIAAKMNLRPGSVIKNLIDQGLIAKKGSYRLKCQLVLEHYKSGITDIQHLCNLFNMRSAEIGRLVQGNKKPPIEHIHERNAAILKLHKEGRLVRDIHSELNLSKEIIWRVLSRNGFHSIDQSVLFETKRKRIVPLLKRGKSQKEIAAALKVGLETIRKVRKGMAGDA